MLDSKQHNMGVWCKLSVEVRDRRDEVAPCMFVDVRSLEFSPITTLDFFSFPEIFSFKFADSAVILMNRKLSKHPIKALRTLQVVKHCC